MAKFSSVLSQLDQTMVSGYGVSIHWTGLHLKVTSLRLASAADIYAEVLVWLHGNLHSF